MLSKRRVKASVHVLRSRSRAQCTEHTVRRTAQPRNLGTAQNVSNRESTALPFVSASVALRRRQSAIPRQLVDADGRPTVIATDCICLQAALRTASLSYYKLHNLVSHRPTDSQRRRRPRNSNLHSNVCSMPESGVQIARWSCHVGLL